MTDQTDSDLKARLKECKRMLGKHGRRLSRCNYFSPKGLAYTQSCRQYEREIGEIEAELKRRQG